MLAEVSVQRAFNLFAGPVIGHHCLVDVDVLLAFDLKGFEIAAEIDGIATGTGGLSAYPLDSSENFTF